MINSQKSAAIKIFMYSSFYPSLALLCPRLSFSLRHSANQPSIHPLICSPGTHSNTINIGKSLERCWNGNCQRSGMKLEDGEDDTGTGGKESGGWEEIPKYWRMTWRWRKGFATEWNSKLIDHFHFKLKECKKFFSFFSCYSFKSLSVLLYSVEALYSLLLFNLNIFHFLIHIFIIFLIFFFFSSLFQHGLR